MSDLRELYRDIILDHGKVPRNLRPLEGATHVAEGYNPLCGDRVTVFLRVDDGRISEATIDGAGCAICMASASMMTQAISTCEESAARSTAQDFRMMLTSKAEVDLDEMGDLAALEGVKRYPMRVKCATLPWHTMVAALDGRDEKATTE